jgi:hypothetical protein
VVVGDGGVEGGQSGKRASGATDLGGPCGAGRAERGRVTCIGQDLPDLGHDVVERLPHAREAFEDSPDGLGW